MTRPLRILHLEDNPNDAELIQAMLVEDGLDFEAVRVDTRANFVATLERGGFDLILCDYSMPSFDGLSALALAKEKRPAVPFIFISGTIGEERAIEALKTGATDYVLKDRIARLPAAVRRALREAKERADLDRANTELARMEKVRETFGQFVTPEVAQFVLAHPQDFWKRGERKVVSILFADVRGFTAFSAQVQPEEVVSALNEIFKLVIDVIQQEGGILNKFIGDGLMALFGAPVPIENHARAAARAAVRMRDAVEALSGSRRQSGLATLRIGIGLNSGEVVAGCVGTRERTEYSVFGNPVNLAARLEQVAAEGQILLGPEIVPFLRETFELRGTVALKLAGIAEPVPATELVGEKQAQQ